MKKREAYYQWHVTSAGGDMSGIVPAKSVGHAVSRLRSHLAGFGIDVHADRENGGWKNLSIAFHGWAD